MANYERVLKLTGIFDKLVPEETTRIVPNLPIEDANPTDVGSSYVIVRNELGYLMPALKIPGIAYQNGDYVNVLYMKGTEPVAFMVGSANPAARIDLYLDDLLDVNAPSPDNNYFLKWDSATSYWLPAPAGSGFTLADLSDVSLAGLGDEDILQYDSVNAYWWNADPLSGLPWDVISVDLVNPGADYSTLSDANTAAGAGDEVYFGPGNYTFTNLTLKGATYRGQGKDVTALSSTFSTGTALTIPDDCILEDLTINHLFTSGSSRTTIGYGGSGLAVIRNCTINLTNTSSGGGIGIAVTGGGELRLENVEIIVDGGSGIVYGLYIFNSSTVTAYNSIINVTTSGTYVTGGAPYHRTVGLLDSTSVFNGYDVQLTPERIWRNGDFSPANITWGWAASPPAQYNPIINGGFNLWQRGTSFVSPASGDYTADRFEYVTIGTAAHTVSRSTDVPTVAQASKLANYSLLVDCTTADTSIITTDETAISHALEGYDWLDFAQQGFWLQFWVKATKTGTYCVSFRNAGNDRTFVAEYTITTTATWEYKEIYIDASPSAGTWDYVNGVGLYIYWMLAAGPSWHTTAWAWNTGNFRATANQVNATDSVANDFRLWGIMMSKTRSPFWQPDYQQELARAQRYYWQVPAGWQNMLGYGRATSATNARVLIPTPVQMRGIPTIAASDLRVAGNGSFISSTGWTVRTVAPNGLTVDFTVSAGLTINQMYTINDTSSDATFSAEL